MTLLLIVILLFLLLGGGSYYGYRSRVLRRRRLGILGLLVIVLVIYLIWRRLRGWSGHPVRPAPAPAAGQPPHRPYRSCAGAVAASNASIGSTQRRLLHFLAADADRHAPLRARRMAIEPTSDCRRAPTTWPSGAPPPADAPPWRASAVAHYARQSSGGRASPPPIGDPGRRDRPPGQAHHRRPAR